MHPVTAHRDRLIGFAYRMLGSVADAEDVIQDAYQRVHDQAEVKLSSAYLMRVVSNLCVDRLRAEQVRRREYSGPWLPEPLLDPSTPADVAQLSEDLSFGFLLLLERLSPAERVVFVLREAFDYSFADIAELLDLSVAACRQRFSRARRRFAGTELPAHEPVAEQKAMLERLVMLVSEGRVEGLVEMLSDDALLISDGGGLVSAAVRPVADRQRIARVLVHIAGRALQEGGLDYRFVNVNGGWGLIVLQSGAPHSCITLESRDGLVRRVYIVRNPDKIRPIGSI